MLLRLKLATKGFVSSLEEEEYEMTKIFENESDGETAGDERTEYSNNHEHSEGEREIFDDENDSGLIKELFRSAE
jgi:hypothetical protein